MRIVVAGIIGRYPWGGVTWCSLMYLLGLRKLGHEVYYLEDTCECNYDPAIDSIATDPQYALKYISHSLEPFGFRNQWCYVDYQGKHHGMERERWEEICRSADLFLVLSGGCWIWREHYLAIPSRVFIDSDPAFTQLAIDKALQEAESDSAKLWYIDFFRNYSHLFTFGKNIGTTASSVPTRGFTWLHTWQPIATDLWNPAANALPPRKCWTTVMTWRIKSFSDIGGNKDEEFIKILNLPQALAKEGELEFELAINGPRELLKAHGWPCIDAFTISSDLWRYHQYLSSSRGEFSVAKKTYVETNSGWFSDRTACYLASGRPAVVQETGFQDFMPTGRGLMSWSEPEQALEALRSVEMDYQAHCVAARELAVEYFEDRKILSCLLDQLG